jgi:hypothetical protein
MDNVKIKVIDSDKLINAINEGSYDINLSDVMALGAVMLDTKKQESCYYCHEDNDGFVMPIEKNFHAFVRFGMDGWELSMKAKGWHGRAKIMYCPMCGRRLER